MRTFIKNNLIATILSLFVIGGLSQAATLTRPYSSADYAGGAKAVGSKVNSEFDNIVAWINGANVASGNIASASISRAKLIGNYVFGSQSGTITITNASTTLRVLSTATTIQTSGRPIRLVLQSPGGSSPGSVNNGGSGTGNSYIYFIQNSSTVASFKVPQILNNPCSGFQFIQDEESGSYDYSAKLSVEYTSGSYETQVTNCQLVVEEL